MGSSRLTKQAWGSSGMIFLETFGQWSTFGSFNIEDGDFGRDRLGRADVDLAKETSFKFQ